MAADRQAARAQLRGRWELASVLNFFHVFEPVIDGRLKICGEEIEDALVEGNADLGRIHLALLKGLVSRSKKMEEPDGWVTLVCKKLEFWWRLVAEGENPLKPNRGEEIKQYKELDPTTRLMILKALCEVRAEQEDILRYITDKLKEGTAITDFRKERIGGNNSGVSYWYDGDPVMGHRLYKEVTKYNVKPHKSKNKDKFPARSFTWETLATSLEEFQQISEKFSSSLAKEEFAVAKMIESDILPVLEDLRRKKERALKRQQRKGMLFDTNAQATRVGITRSCRERKPVCYTFEEYDRSITEAIQVATRAKIRGNRRKDDGADEGNLPSEDSDKENCVPQSEVLSEGKLDDYIEDEDDDYIEDEDDDRDLPLGGRDNRQNVMPRKKHSETAKNNKMAVVGLRRSSRNADSNAEAAADGENVQKPAPNAVYTECVVSDSDFEDDARI